VDSRAGNKHGCASQTKCWQLSPGRESKSKQWPIPAFRGAPLEKNPETARAVLKVAVRKDLFALTARRAERENFLARLRLNQIRQ
jgi:hypothetical protein